MSHVIWKYQLTHTAKDQTVTAPEGPVVYAAMQHDLPTVWLHVDLATNTRERTFRLVGTGDQSAPGPNDALHVGTLMDGPFVWHLFELTQAAS